MYFWCLFIWPEVIISGLETPSIEMLNEQIFYKKIQRLKFVIWKRSLELSSRFESDIVE